MATLISPLIISFSMLLKKLKMKLTGKLIWVVFSKGFPFVASRD